MTEKKKPTGGFLHFLKVFFTQRASPEAVELAESYADLELKYRKVDATLSKMEMITSGGEYILLLQEIQQRHLWGSVEYLRIQAEIDKTLKDIS